MQKSIRIFALLGGIFLIAPFLPQWDSATGCAAASRAPSRLQNSEKNWLVAVGINKYQEERVNPLRFCKADAQAIHAFFTQSGIVPESNAYLLVTDQTEAKFQPTRLNILESIQYVAERAGPESTIIIFFAGHGFVDRDGKSYLLPQDGKISLLRDTGVSIDRVNEMLRESKSTRKALFLDACRNAPIRDARGGPDEKSTEIFLEALKSGAGQVTLAACKEGQTSFEDSTSGHGVFTLHVLRGLQGEARADSNGLINVSTLQEYLAKAVPAWASKHRKPPQEPWMWGEMSSPIPLAVAGEGVTLVALRDSIPVPPAQSRMEKLSLIVLPSVFLLVVSVLLQVFLHRRSRKEMLAVAGNAVPVASSAAPVARAEQPAVSPPIAASEAQPAASAMVETPLSFSEKKPADGMIPDTFSSAIRPFPGALLPDGMDKARLVFEGAESGRKVLILIKPRVGVGVNKFTRDPKVDLTLRLLPCRSQEQDPENWKRNLLISSPHFTIEAREDAFLIRDEMTSKNGTFLAELRGGEDEADKSVSDADTVFQTAGAMETLDKVTFMGISSQKEGEKTGLPKGTWTPLPERCSITIGQQAMVLHARTFTSSHWHLYALRLKRVENFPILEYILLVRRAYIGSDPNCPIRIGDPGFPRLAAALDFNKGRYFLTTGQGEVRVLLNGKALVKGSTTPITHASLIEIGAYRWRFEPANIDDFTEVC